MTLYDIVLDYIRKKKVLFSSYVIVCCVGYLVKVLVSSAVYSKLFEKDANFEVVIKNICMVWVALCVLFVLKSRIETILIPDFFGYLRTTLFDRYIRNNEVRFNDTNVTGDVNKILEVTRNIRDVFLWITGTFIPTVTLMICITLFFIVKFPYIGIVNIIGNVLSYYVIKTSSPTLIESANQKDNQFMEMVGKIEENVNNLLNIYINNKIEDTIRDTHNAENEYLEVYKIQNKELESFSMRIKAINYFFAFISMSILYKTSNNHLEFVNALLIFTFYLTTLENMSEDIPFSLVTFGNIKNIEKFLMEKDPNHLALNPSYPISQRSNKIADVNASLEFRGVTFRYNETSPYILDDFSMKVKAGERVALVGQSGFGKTTTMKLLLGFYSIEKGEILINNVDINTIYLDDLRSRINYVNQKTLLLNDTVIANMQYGNQKSPEEIVDFLKKYNLLSIFCDSTISPTVCLDRIVERNGSNISLGMQKIIFLVRGILKDNVAVYVFDEPLTSVDPGTRRNVIRMLKEETGNKTVLIITHDQEVEEIVDRVIKLDKK